MFSKDELLSKDVTDLATIAKELGVTLKTDESQEDIIYAILDKQAIEEGSKNPLGTKRKRTRIAKKDTDRVYTVKGKEGENLDAKKSKTTVEQKSLFKDEEMTSQEDAVKKTEEVAAVQPKRRGRKPKKETEPIAAAETPHSADDDKSTIDAGIVGEQANEASEDVAVNHRQEEAIPEAAFAAGSADKADAEKDSLLEQLQAKINDRVCPGGCLGRRPRRRHRLHHRGRPANRRPRGRAQFRHVRQPHDGWHLA